MQPETSEDPAKPTGGRRRFLVGVIVVFNIAVVGVLVVLLAQAVTGTDERPLVESVAEPDEEAEAVGSTGAESPTNNAESAITESTTNTTIPGDTAPTNASPTNDTIDTGVDAGVTDASAPDSETPEVAPIDPRPTLAPGAIPGDQTWRVTHQIDRSGLPLLSFTALTLNVFVGAIDEATVTVDGQTTPHLYDPTSGYVTVTTTGSTLVIDAAGATLGDDLGFAVPAPLKDDKDWAWSHGFDDNVDLGPSLDAFEARGWRGSIYLIGSQVSASRDQPWVIDSAAARRRLNNGWSLGGHGWSNACDDFDEPNVTRSMNRIGDIVAGSSRTGYTPIAFAAPCFLAEYHPVVLDMRDRGVTDIAFNESGSDFVQIVDSDAESYWINDRQVVAFDFDNPIGRDPRIEFTDFVELSADIDWIASQATDERHIWYNSLSHGGHETRIASLLTHISDNYGPGGSDEVWVAPADEVYSYLIVRDGAKVSEPVVEQIGAG